MIVTIKGQVEMAGQASELITDLVVIVGALKGALSDAIDEDAEILIRAAVERGLKGEKENG